MSFKYCDPCAIALKLPELAARGKEDCENCGAVNVECNFGDKKPSKPKAKEKAPAKKKAAAKKPDAKKAAPKAKAKSKASKK